MSSAIVKGETQRVLYYCHEGLGLGHLRRAVKIGQHLADRWPGAAQLIVTSSAAASLLVTNEHIDYVKLPSVERVGPEGSAEPFVPRSLPMPFQNIWRMRRDLLLAVVRHFRPTLLLADFMPAGLKGELVPTLRYIRKHLPGTRLVLGLRDIPDAASRTRQAWTVDGAYELLDTVYDRILVYGQRDVYDLAARTGLSARVAAKVRYVGYLRPETAARSSAQIRAELGLRTDRLVLVTVGGGTDGFDVLSAMIEALRCWPEMAQFDCLLVAGPLMPQADFERLRERAPANPRVRLVSFLKDLSEYIGASDAVVSRAGYNSVCEILASRRPAVLIPRVLLRGVEDNHEQRLRAEALHNRGLTRLIYPSSLTPELLLQTVKGLLDEPQDASTMLGLDGLPAVAAELKQLITQSAP